MFGEISRREAHIAEIVQYNINKLASFKVCQEGTYRAFGKEELTYFYNIINTVVWILNQGISTYENNLKAAVFVVSGCFFAASSSSWKTSNRHCILCYKLNGYMKIDTKVYKKTASWQNKGWRKASLSFYFLCI